MKFDLSDFNHLEFENIGSWPKRVKVVVALCLLLVLLLMGYQVLLAKSVRELSQVNREEIKLKQTFAIKYPQSAQLAPLQNQLLQLEVQYEAALFQFPSRDNMPELVSDITRIAQDLDVVVKRLSRQPPQNHKRFVEYPISFIVVGRYHQIGEMLSQIAKLPFIVIFQDLTITPSRGELLEVTMLAKTYRLHQDIGVNALGSKNEGD